MRALVIRLHLSGFYADTEEQPMEPLDLIRDKFSQDGTIKTVLHLLMAHFDMTEEAAQTEIDSYFEIVD